MSNKRCTFTLEEKVDILDKLKLKSTATSLEQFASEIGIGFSTLKKIRKEEDDIRKLAVSNANLQRKRKRESPHEEVGDALVLWFQQMLAKNVPINGPLMLEKAKQLALELGHEDFDPDRNWLDRLKKRHNIKKLTVSGEKAAADHVGAREWIENIYPSIVKDWDQTDIFNADETGLFFRATPNSTLGFAGSQATGGKTAKDRITALFICNSTGTEKRIYVIGKYKNPRCFKHSRPPLPYYSSANAWMTSWIWSDLLGKFDRELGNRKILLFVDNAACHKLDVELKNIHVIFMPPNVTSLIQPLDQGIIRAAKAHYRTQLVRKMIKAVEQDTSAIEFSKSIDLLKACHMLKRSWFLVTPSTIKNCFKKAGFISNDDEEADELPIQVEEYGISTEAFNAFIECDSTLECFGTLSDQEICASVKRGVDEQAAVEVDSDDENVVDIVEAPVKHAEAVKALAVVQKYLEQNATEYDALYDIEDMIDKIGFLSLNQSKITDFFKKF